MTEPPSVKLARHATGVNGNHPLATGYQAFDACFRRRVYRATACGLSAGALPGWRDLHPSAYGHAAGEVGRARSPPWFYGRACKTMLKGVSVARLTLWKPPAPITSRTRASPACAGRRTDLLRERGRQADHHRTRVIKVGRPGSNFLRGGRLPSAQRPSTRRPEVFRSCRRRSHGDGWGESLCLYCSRDSLEAYGMLPNLR